MTRTVTHPEHQEDYNKGWGAMIGEIQQMGWAAARDKWISENYDKPSSLAAYYYADGGLSCLAAKMRART